MIKGHVTNNNDKNDRYFNTYKKSIDTLHVTKLMTRIFDFLETALSSKLQLFAVDVKVSSSLFFYISHCFPLKLCQMSVCF